VIERMGVSPVRRTRLLIRTALVGFALAAAAASGAAIPKASDYHSLLVLSPDAKALLLGTHQGLFRSTDGGHRWRPGGLRGEDAMNLVRAGNTILMGGHDVYAESTNDGRSWRHFRPAGLPSLDVHGLAVDPRAPNVVYAQIAGTGLYRSTDGGFSFRLVSSDVNGAMMQVAVTPAGRLVVGDMSRGIWLSQTGRKWTHAATGMVMGVAVDPRDGNRVVATGRGIAISSDGGKSWSAALPSKRMFGPVAWAPDEPGLVYAVGYDRLLACSRFVGAAGTS
jgi:Photosynthesis system II assembly factor YCF48